MNYYSVFYWLTVADGVKQVFDTFSNIFTFFSVISCIAYVVVIAFAVDMKKGDAKELTAYSFWRKFIARTFWTATVLCLITWIGYVMTPTKKDCMLIVAGGAVGNFITTDSSSKALPADITKYLHLSLNKEIEDLNKEVGGNIRKELGIESSKDKFVNSLKDLSKEQIIEYLQNDTTIKK